MKENIKLSGEEPTDEQIIIALIFEEWVKDSACLDSKESWDASDARPFPYEVILGFLAHMGFDGIENLGNLMFTEATVLICGIISKTDICPGCLFKEALLLGATRGDSTPNARATFKRHKLSKENIEVVLRGTALCLNVLHGDWPFAYEFPDGTNDPEILN